jgi:hypothetical protein
MKTTVAFYSGSIRDEHKYLQTYKFSDGYAVEEKGVSFEDNLKELQRKRFESDPTLLRIDIHEPGMAPETLLR